MKKNLKTILIIISIFALLGMAGFALALEINYPRLPGAEAPQDFMPKVESGEYTRDQVIPLYLKYFYVLFVAFSGLIAFAALAYGGFIYLTSGGNPGRISDAKDQIVSAFFGIIILLGSFMFLLLLDPDLTVLQVPGLQKAIFPPAAPVTLSGQKTYTYWELPLGTIEENLLKKNEIAKIAASALNNASIAVNQKTQELNSLLNQCKCSRLGSVCSLSSCVDNTACSGTYTQLCPNSTLIASKRQELSSALQNLKAKREDVYIKTVALFKEDLRMRYTQSFLDDCQAEPYDIFTFIESQEDKTIGSLIEKRKIWTDMDSEYGNTSLICSSSPSPIYLPSASGSCKLSNTDSFWSIPKLSDLPSFVAILEAASETFHVPPSLLSGVMYGEGAFNPGKYDWTNENIENWSCEGGGVPNCDPTVFLPTTQGIVPFQSESIWNSLKDAVQEVAPGRVPNPCNLMDAIFAVAKHLSHGALGSKDPGYDFTGTTCFGISLNAGHSVHTSDCSWDQRDIQTAIKVWESGYLVDVCLSKTGGCAGGRGMAAACPDDDHCEHYNDCFTGAGNCSSHPYCIWSVTNFYK
jgi:hypothetical protein